MTSVIEIMFGHPLYRFWLPPDAFSWVMLGLGVVVFAWPARWTRPFSRAPRKTLGLLALVAAVLSWSYFHFWLDGAPRIIDATAYSLAGRTLALGSFTFTPPEPTALFRGRFLIHPPDDPLRLGVIFPPGYPLLLALGELTHARMLVGPVLASLLVVLTYLLAVEVTRHHVVTPWGSAASRDVGLLAATFSALSACLRYHTADTMSHGWSAVLATALVWITLRLRRLVQPNAPQLFQFIAFGFLLGWLVATRQLTGVVFGVVLGGALGGALLKNTAGAWLPRLQPLAFFALFLASLPGLGLLLAQHVALTGHFDVSPQLRYYLLADGPRDCFGLGLGKGCLFEHGDVVRRQGGGLTLWWMLRNTLQRLHAHALDVAHFELLFLPVVVWFARERRAAAGRLFLALYVALALAYSLFYFDGSYPGGGARFFVELLPLAHVALAAVLLDWKLTRPAVALSLVGFALHASHSHAHLRTQMEGPPVALGDSDGDEPSITFVESDHAFLALFEPRALPEENAHDEDARVKAGRVGASLRGRLIARRTYDRREAALVERFTQRSPDETQSAPDEASRAPDETSRAPSEARVPEALSGDARPLGPGPTKTKELPVFVVERGTNRRMPWVAPVASTVLPFVLEAESEWPPRALAGIWVHPSYPPGSCVSRGRGLQLHATEEDEAREFVFEASGVDAGRYRVRAVYWSPDLECQVESVGDLTLPALVTLRPPVRPGQELHLDRLELEPLDAAGKAAVSRDPRSH